MRTSLRPDRTERGFTLIEVLITVALVSVGFIGILSAVGSMITAGAENTNAATSLATVRNLAAFMQTQAYKPCGAGLTAPIPLYASEVAGFTPPTGYTASVSAVDAWNGDSPATFVKGPDGVTPDTQGTCPAAGGDRGLEQLTLSIVPPNGQLGAVATRTITILKRQHP